MEEKLSAKETELSKVTAEKGELDKEHEDLLVMLSDQYEKVTKYKVWLLV